MNTTNDLTEKEFADIELRASKVSNLLKRSAELWLEIATEVNDAKHHLSASAYSIFLTKAGLTAAIADKMPRIAKDAILYSDEMRPHIKKLEGWSTLYEVAKLKSDEKKCFVNSLNDNPDQIVSRAFVQSFRSCNSLSQNSNLLVAQIIVNNDDLKRFDYQQFLDLKQRIDDISRIIDRMSPAVTMNIVDKNVTAIEQIISNADQNSDTDIDNECDVSLPITIPVSDNNYSITQVAF